MARILISNALIVNEGRAVEGDVLIRAGRIESIGSFSNETVDQVIEADGACLLPGMIDAHMCCRAPDQSQYGDFYHETLAAVAGGITTVLEVPNVNPLATDLLSFTEKQALAASRSLANFALFFPALKTNFDVIKALDPEVVCGVVVYLGAAGGSALIDDADALDELFSECPVPLLAHCEDMPTIAENEEAYRRIYGDDIDISLHPKIRTDEACYSATEVAVKLAEKHRTQLHLSQISSALEKKLLSKAPTEEKRITADTAAHYLHFSASDYQTMGGLLKCHPAIKFDHDRAALIQSVLDGRIDCLVSGHTPVRCGQKTTQSYFNIISGVPTIQRSLLALLEHVHDGIFSLEMLVEKTSHNVAKRFNIEERGFIREGYWADLVLIDMSEGLEDKHQHSFSNAGCSLYDGYHFRSSVKTTLVNGEVVWHEGKHSAKQGHGRALELVR